MLKETLRQHLFAVKHMVAAPAVVAEPVKPFVGRGMTVPCMTVDFPSWSDIASTYSIQPDEEGPLHQFLKDNLVVVKGEFVGNKRNRRKQVELRQRLFARTEIKYYQFWDKSPEEQPLIEFSYFFIQSVNEREVPGMSGMFVDRKFRRGQVKI